MRTKRHRLRLATVLAAVAGIVLISGLGWLCMRYSWAGAIPRLSYDLLFALRNRSTPDVAIVFMDEQAGRALGQKYGVWDRRVHARLIRRMTREGARAVFFDLAFLDPAFDPAEDEDLAAAMKENGHVFIGATLERGRSMGGAKDQVLNPIEKLSDSAADYGLLAFFPGPDYGVRTLDTGNEIMASATWVMAGKLGAPLPDDPEFRALPRWINYYGPVDTLDSVSYDRALQPDGVPDGFFRNRVVFVGGRSSIGQLGLGKDEFGHPHTRWTREFAPGVAIHATVFLNLLRQEWLTRWSPQKEEGFALGFGMLLALALPRFRPVVAATIAVLLMLGLVVWTGSLLEGKRTWFAWCVPVLVQIPLALGWAIGTRYFLEERGRSKLRKAFGHYLSEDMADRIADADFDLEPGGEVVEATIVFTDLQGFTQLSETIGDPKKVAEVLVSYFTNTTQHILENKGTIIKYIGDSVFAVWGAPLPDEDHAGKATLAAWKMHLASEKVVLGHHLTTRVGVHTGEVLAGNLGSAYRFDYTLIGDAVNFASRLEGLNKYLGTQVLVSDATARRFAGRFLTRRLGEFKVAGKDHCVGVHELLGPSDEVQPMPWLDTFAAGVAAFCHGELEEAERRMRAVCEQRGGHDGPAEYYLTKIKELNRDGLPAGWAGTMELTSK